MDQSSRKSNIFKNLITNILPYFIVGILGFIQVKVFLNNLGEEIQALNQLFIQIFSYISLVEGGVGAVIVQKYYKLLIDDDKEEIKRVYLASIKALKKISLLIILIGIGVSFSLKFLTNNSLSLFYMQVVFLLFIIRSVLEYLSLSPRFVLMADQKAYKINLLLNIFKIIEALAIIGILYIGGSFIIVLLISIVIRIIMYILINNKIFKEYPWLKIKSNASPLKLTNIGYMYCHKLVGAVNSNTDIILISAKLSPELVIVYTTYNYITKYIADLIYMASTSILSSLGNVIYKDDKQKSYNTFEEINSFFLFFACFFAINVFLLIDNFVTCWVGQKYVITTFTLLLFVLIFFNTIANRVFGMLCEATAKYKETTLIVSIQAILNLVLSIVFLFIFGLNGVLLATVISFFVTIFWFYPYYMYKNLFQKKCYIYFVKYLVTVILTIAITYAIKTLNLIKATSSWWTWLLQGVICSVISGIIIFISFYIMFPSFKNFINSTIKLLKTKILERRKRI